MTSPAEYESALRLLEQNPPEIRMYSDDVRGERWAHLGSPRQLWMSFREERL